MSGIVREVTIGPCRLIQGDCLEVLPLIGKVDITVSSPPYNMIPKTKPSGIYAEHNHKLNTGYSSHGDDMPQDSYEEWLRSVFSLCRDLSRGLVWVNHKCKFENKAARHPVRYLPWEIHGEIIWDRGGSLTLNANRYAPSHEGIYAFGVPHYWNRCNDMELTVWRIPPETKVEGHPCPFPVVIPQRCIESSCPFGGIVLDPFAGSGSTGVAAIASGRRFVGIEKDDGYFDVMARRIRRAWQDKQSEIKWEPEPVPVQLSLMGDDQ